MQKIGRKGRAGDQSVVGNASSAVDKSGRQVTRYQGLDPGEGPDLHQMDHESAPPSLESVTTLAYEHPKVDIRAAGQPARPTYDGRPGRPNTPLK